MKRCFDYLLEATLGVGLVIHALTYNEIEWVLTANLILIGDLMLLVALRYPKINLRPWKLSIPIGILGLLAIFRSPSGLDGLFALSLISAYIVGLNTKGRSYILVALLVIATTISLIIASDRTGGIITNRNLAVGVLVIGTLLYNGPYKWVLVLIASIGLYYTGAEQAIVGVAILILTILVRRDWSPKLILPIVMLVLLVSIGSLTGLTSKLWSTVPQRILNIVDAQSSTQLDEGLGYRLDDPGQAVTNLTLFGNGYNPYGRTQTEIHNVPLRILQELGPIGLGLWLFIVIIALVYTKGRYLIIATLALSIFDHYMWSVLAPLMFAGLASTTYYVKDYI